jgi:predicted O-linked N-acetylglucosamine transferase (SPINDLY family)
MPGSSITIPQALELAAQQLRAGQIQQAYQLYQQILSIDPNNAAALQQVGVIRYRTQGPASGIELLQRAAAVDPHSAGIQLDLGNVLCDLGRRDEALAAYRRAIELDPNSAGAWSNLGATLLQFNRAAEAIGPLRQAAGLSPQVPEIQVNLGNALRLSGDPHAAIQHFERAIAQRPTFADAHNSLGLALQQIGALDRAADAHRRAIAQAPQPAFYHASLASTLAAAGDVNGGAAAYSEALSRDPNSFEALNGLGMVLQRCGRSLEAIDLFRRAIALRPQLAALHSNLANAMKEAGLIREAIAANRHAIELDPNSWTLHSNLCALLQFDPDQTPQAIFEEHRAFNQRHARGLQSVEPPRNMRDPQRRLRIGYLSPDFREHSVAYFIEGLLATHDRGAVEVYCYADLVRPDATTQRLQRHADVWRPITGMSDDAAAALIRQDEIDILIDLAGHTGFSRPLLLARKPAPVQVSYLGYPNTSGLDAMDWLLTDHFVDPPGMTESQFSEKLLRLPRTFASYTPPASAAAEVVAAPALSSGAVTFGSFNVLSKLNAPLLKCWAGILRELPESRLMLCTRGIDQPSNKARISGIFQSHGVEPARIECVGAREMPDYLRLHERVDLALDSFPVNGHTITCHALWMGVPVIALAGRTHPSRLGVSVLSNLNLTDLIAADTDSYVRLAVELGGNIPRLAGLRAGMRQRMSRSPLLDHAAFARDVEAAYRRVWMTYCRS